MGLSYIPLYALSKGLKVANMTNMAKRGINIGGSHFHRTFCLQGNDNVALEERAQAAYLAILRDPIRHNYLRSLNIIHIDEIGQLSAEMLYILDVILRMVRNNNVFFGGIIIIGTMDQRQLAPVRGKPFLVSSNVITCFEFIRFEYSIRAGFDELFQRLQYIVRLHPSRYDNKLLDEFESLLSQVCFTIHLQKNVSDNI